jgi:hypothetical protein
MFGKKAVLVALVTGGLVLSAVAVASADPPFGFTSVVIGRGQASRSFEVHQRKGNDVAVTRTPSSPPDTRAGTRTQAPP